MTKVNQTLLFTLLCIMYTGTVSIYASPPVFSSFTSWESGAIVPFKRTELEKSQITWRGKEKLNAYPLRLDQTIHWYPLSSISLKIGGRLQATRYYDHKQRSSPLFAFTQAHIEWTPVSPHIPSISLGLHRLPYGLAYPLQRWGSISRLDSLWSSNVNPLDRLGTGIQISSQFLPYMHTHPFTFPRLVKRNQGTWFYQITAFIPTQPNGNNFNSQQWVLWARSGYHSRTTLIELQFHQAYLNTPTPTTSLSVGSLHGQRTFFSSFTPLIYRGEVFIRSWNQTLSPLEEAQQSLLDQAGIGFQVHHQIEWQLYPFLSTSLAYSWQDPHFDFGYDTRHQLSIMTSWHYLKAFQILALYHHNWSAHQNRWSFKSDEVLLCLRGDFVFN